VDEKDELSQSIPKDGWPRVQFDGCVGALEDKIVQRATVAVLNAIYEEDFLGFSYGFRAGRGPHDALDALVVGISSTKVNWILDADIRSFFDEVSPEMGDVVMKPCKCATIRRHRMIVEVACNDLLQPLALFGNWLMHPLSQFLLNLLKLSLHAVPPGLPLDQEVTAPGFAADEGKAQEVEGLRFAKPTPFAVGRCKATELN